MHAGVDSKVDVDNSRGESAERSRVETGEIATMGIDKRGNLGEEGSEIGARCYTWKGVPEGERWSKRGKAAVSQAGVVFKYSLIN